MKSNSRFSHLQQKEKQKQKLIISYFIGSALISIVILFVVLGSNLQFRKNFSQNLSQIIIAGIPLSPHPIQTLTQGNLRFSGQT